MVDDDFSKSLPSWSQDCEQCMILESQCGVDSLLSIEIFLEKFEFEEEH